MTEPRDDARPQPRFGQYATPEEQRARMGLPSAPETRAPVPAAPVAPPSADAAPRLSGGRLIDRAATVAMLVYGIFSVIQSIPLVLDTTRLLETMGLDVELADPAGVRIWGVAAVIVLTLGWMATALLSWRVARRGRLTFWVPIAGAVVFNLLASIVVVIPLVSDPAVGDAVLRMQESFGS
ncbi:DUF6264 family protein [Microbacterium barkeri]|uniref:DUF6264 family protein n=1 Tax=Microbacterium barkeri TaxID=33917 RepID=UPI0024AEC937|nr:DUF6264 family protein [Microbacterium barkeri]MDI6944058.1 DUF6264 family protein [Microbacterium barkeri]